MRNHDWQHRQNPDRSWDSICPHCALIVARVDHPSQLPAHERQHVCDPAHLTERRPINFNVFFAR